MALLWGLSWPAGRVLALAMPAVSSAAWRFTLASAMLLAWLRWRDGRWPAFSRRQWIGLAVGGAVGVAGYAVCFMIALQQVSASRAAVVVTTNPVFTSLLAAWLFKEAFNARIALGMALAVAGAVTVLTHGAPWTLVTGGVGAGEWWLVACIATWVSYTLIGRRLLVGIDPLAATAVSAAIGTVLLWAAVLASEGAPRAWDAIAQLGHSGWLSLVFLAIGATVLAYVWFFRGVGVLGAGMAARYISLVPVFGVASSVVLLGEPLDGSLLVGGLLALTGVVIANGGRGG